MNSNFRQDPRAAAWEVLIRMDVRELPVRPAKICKAKGVKIRYCMLSRQNKGAAFILKGIPVILIAESEHAWQKRFAVAHELGHIVLGHVGEKRVPSYDSPIENVANAFAAELLAPACVLKACGVQSAEDIMQICGIIRGAAENQAKHIRDMQGDVSPLEREICIRFEEYIKSNRITDRPQLPANPESYPAAPLSARQSAASLPRSHHYRRFV